MAFQAGLELLEAGFYWEAHEVLEPVWMNARANTPERHFVQALIQLANAALKLLMQRPGAATRLIDISTELLERSGPDETVMGLRLSTVRQAIEMLRICIEDNQTTTILVRGSADTP